MIWYGRSYSLCLFSLFSMEFYIAELNANASQNKEYIISVEKSSKYLQGGMYSVCLSV